MTALIDSSSPPPSSSSSPPHPSYSSTPPPTAAAAMAPVVMSPCAACKILRRRCAEKCVLAPYFPPTDPAKFAIAHRVFGASNIIKFLQELPEAQRADAVSSMVYEASARIRDPVYGCAGSICQLQKQVSELQSQLAKAQAEVVNMQCQQAQLMALLCMEKMAAQSPDIDQQQAISPHQSSFDNFINASPQSYQSNSPINSFFLDDNNCLGSMWESPLWT